MPVVAGEKLAVGFADAADAEGVDETSEGDRAAGLDGGEEVVDGALLPAFAGEEFVGVAGEGGRCRPEW